MTKKSISDEPESNPKIQRELEDLIDQAGLRNVLFMLASVCSVKASAHAKNTEGDLGSRWNEASSDLVRLARRVMVLR